MCVTSNTLHSRLQWLQPWVKEIIKKLFHIIILLRRWSEMIRENFIMESSLHKVIWFSSVGSDSNPDSSKIIFSYWYSYYKGIWRSWYPPKQIYAGICWCLFLPDRIMLTTNITGKSGRVISCEVILLQSVNVHSGLCS